MKKILSLLLVFVMVAALFAGCGGKKAATNIKDVLDKVNLNAEKPWDGYTLCRMKIGLR